MKNQTRCSLFPLCACVLLFATSATAHDVHTTGDVVLDSALDAAHLVLVADAPSFRDMLPADARLATTRIGDRDAGTADPARLGVWSNVADWPVLPVHASLLPNGKVLAWDATPDDFGDDVHTAERFETRVTVWDPASNTHLRANNDTDTDLFCAGSAHLWDGRVLFAGGDGGRAGTNGPLSNSNLYDPFSNTWSRTDDLIAPRWYSSVAALGTGEMLTFGGAYTPTPIAEVLGFNKRWRGLPVQTQYSFSGDYHWLQSTSDGDVMYLGPHNTLSRLETSGSGTWTQQNARDDVGYRGYGSYAMYDIDRVLVAGGENSLASAVIVDTKNATSTLTAPMQQGRRQHNLTILADGSVLATGGNRTGANFLDLNGGVLETERWDPVDGQWTTLASATVDRQYHSIALLLADGRVLVGGGGYCPECSLVGYHEQNVEIYSPPYLFAEDGTFTARPAAAAVPTLVNYGEHFVVDTGDSTRIRRAHLIRPGSVTHSQNQEQRLIPLDILARGDGLQLAAPDNRDIAPPGHYLLFLVDADGIPSIGRFIQIGQPLIQAAEVVTNRLQANRPDYYAIEARGAHRLSVSLRRGDTDVSLFVAAGRLPALASGDQSGLASCLMSNDGNGLTRCDVSAPADTTWYIGLSGPVGSEYSLIAHLDTIDALPLSASNQPAAADTRVTGLTAGNLSDRAVSLAWIAPSTSASLDGYEIWRDDRLIDYRRSAGFRERSLAPAMTYRYHVVAVFRDLTRGRPSRTMVVTTPPSDQDYQDRYSPYIPSQPTGLRHVRYSATAAELFWEPSFDNGVVTSYEIWRDGMLYGTSGGLSFFDNALAQDTDHVWFVLAIDDQGNRSVASTATGTALLPPTPAGEQPVIPVADAGDDESGETVPAEHEVATGSTPTIPVAPGSNASPTGVAGAYATPASRSGGGGAGGTGLIIIVLLAFVAIGRRTGMTGWRVRWNRVFMPSSIGSRTTDRLLVSGAISLAMAACSGANPSASPDALADDNPRDTATDTPTDSLIEEIRREADADAVSRTDTGPELDQYEESDQPLVAELRPEPDAPTDSAGLPDNADAATTHVNNSPYVGRPWHQTARAAQETVAALGLYELRTELEATARSLGLYTDTAVERNCPGGGYAQVTSEITPSREHRSHEFAACTTASGATIDGRYVMERRNADSEYSIKRDLEEDYAVRFETATRYLEANGELTEAVSGQYADGCGLAQREIVLRIHLPSYRRNAITATRLAIEDISNVRVLPSENENMCGTSETEFAFSDSARVIDAVDSGNPFGFSVNRTGSLIRDAHGQTASSGSDIRIRIYHPDDDASLDLDPTYAAPDAVRITIDNHPGRTVFDDVWQFLSS